MRSELQAKPARGRERPQGEHAEARLSKHQLGFNEGSEPPGCDPPVGNRRLIFRGRSSAHSQAGF